MPGVSQRHTELLAEGRYWGMYLSPHTTVRQPVPGDAHTTVLSQMQRGRPGWTSQHCHRARQTRLRVLRSGIFRIISGSAVATYGASTGVITTAHTYLCMKTRIEKPPESCCKLDLAQDSATIMVHNVGVQVWIGYRDAADVMLWRLCVSFIPGNSRIKMLADTVTTPSADY